MNPNHPLSPPFVSFTSLAFPSGSITYLLPLQTTSFPNIATVQTGNASISLPTQASQNFPHCSCSVASGVDDQFALPPSPPNPPSLSTSVGLSGGVKALITPQSHEAQAT